MIHAYDQTLLIKSRTSLGWMLDLAVNLYGCRLNDFYRLFLDSAISAAFERGDSAIIAGMSGSELAYKILVDSSPGLQRQESTGFYERSPEYWTGHSLAYYQWYMDENFIHISEYIDILEIRGMYHKYHEMDISQFVDALMEKKQEYSKFSTLKRLRAYAGYSQRLLSEETGVPLRTIQQYEQNQKDIHKAGADVVYRLSKALFCKPEDLLR